MLNKLLLTLLLLAFGFNGQSQNVLSLSEAIGLALESNLNIKLAKNDLEFAKNQNFPGNAGMRPNVTLNINDNPSLGNLRQELADGRTIIRNNVFSNTLGGNVALNYTLFDGMRMYATRDRLKELENMGTLQLKSSIQNTVSEVIASYSDILRQQSMLKVLKSLEKVSKERLALIETRKTSGLANDADLFLAQLEADQRKQSVDVQQVMITNAKTNLKQLINKSEDYSFEIVGDLNNVQTLEKNKLKASLNKNPTWMMAEKQLAIAEKVKIEVKSAFYPLVRLNAQLGYSRLQSQAGFLLVNQNFGPTAGFGLSLPLYTGKVNKRNLDGATIQLKRVKLQQDLVQQNINSAFEIAWQNYKTCSGYVIEDKKAIETASKLLNLVEQRYKAGEGTVLDFREVQRTFEEINNRFINNQFNLKLAETDLLNLTGGLLQE